MPKFLQILIPTLIATLLVSGIVWAANNFPTSLNNWGDGDVISSDWGNSLESKMGITNSADTSSLDYMVNQRITWAAASSTYFSVRNWELYDGDTLRPTSTTVGLIVSASSTFIGTITSSGGFIGNLTGSVSQIGTLTNTKWCNTDGSVINCAQDTPGGGGSNWQFIGANAIRPTSTVGIIVNASSTFSALTTFNEIPILPSTNPSSDNQAARKAYVDSLVVSIFGDGSDGALTLYSDATLTDDVYYTNLTLSATSTPTLSANGYRIFVSGTLTNGGIIEHKGGNGVLVTPGKGATSTNIAALGGGSGGSAGLESVGAGGGGGGVLFITAKTITNNGTITVAGGNGGNGASSSGAGQNNGVAGISTTTSLGGSGGAGGNADGLGGYTLATGGSGGTVTAPLAKYGGFRDIVSATLMRAIDPGTFNNWHDSLVKGGTGGGSGAISGGAGSATCVGGGGGGGGGVIVLIYNTLTSGTESVAGGSGGTGYNGGDGCDLIQSGTAGSSGNKITLDIQ